MNPSRARFQYCILCESHAREAAQLRTRLEVARGLALQSLLELHDEQHSGAFDDCQQCRDTRESIRNA